MIHEVGMSILLALALAAAAEPPSLDASKLTLSAPAAIVELDTKKLKGDLYRLAWSPDARAIYVQTVTRDSMGNVASVHHYLVGFDSKSPKALDAEPAWANTYWAWKSAQAAPGVPSLKITVEQRQKRVTATATPMGGELARGGLEGGSPTSAVGVSSATGDAMSAAAQSQFANYYTLKLKGEVVGEFVNTPAIPGLTFGWAPSGTGVIAFSNQGGHVVVMDEEGRKQEVPDTKSAWLPAWSDDGRRLAYVERTGKNKVTLKVVDVTESH